MTTTDRFDEHSLRADIAAKWGEYGAHIDVFDTLLKRLRELEEATKDTAFIKTEATVDEAFAAIRKVREACPDVRLRVLTSSDVISHLLGVDDDLRDDIRAEAREVIINSWEWKHWEDMQEDDWSWFDTTDNMSAIIAKVEGGAL